MAQLRLEQEETARQQAARLLLENQEKALQNEIMLIDQEQERQRQRKLENERAIQGWQKDVERKLASELAQELAVAEKKTYLKDPLAFSNFMDQFELDRVATALKYRPYRFVIQNGVVVEYGDVLGQAYVVVADPPPTRRRVFLKVTLIDRQQLIGLQRGHEVTVSASFKERLSNTDYPDLIGMVLRR